jgi:hypothetical protein
MAFDKGPKVHKCEPADARRLQDNRRRATQSAAQVGLCVADESRPQNEIGEAASPKASRRSSGRPLQSAAQTPVQRAYTVRDVVVLARIGRTKIYEEIKAGRLKSFVLCGRRLIMSDDFEDWLVAARDAA